MPDNLPMPHVPPIWQDRILIHPELMAAVFAALAGVGIALDSASGAHWLVRVPWLLGVPLGLALAVSGTIAAVGIVDPTRRHVEQHGWHILIVTAMMLAGVLTYTHTYRLVVLLSVQWAAIGAVRAFALASIRAQERRIVAVLGRDGEV